MHLPGHLHASVSVPARGEEGKEGGRGGRKIIKIRKEKKGSKQHILKTFCSVCSRTCVSIMAMGIDTFLEVILIVLLNMSSVFEVKYVFLGLLEYF